MSDSMEFDMDALWEEQAAAVFGEQSIDQSTSQSTSQSASQPTNQSVEQSRTDDQSASQPTEKPAKVKGKPGRRKGSKNSQSNKSRESTSQNDPATPSKSPNQSINQSKRRRDHSRREKARKEEENRHEDQKKHLSESAQIRYDVLRKSQLNSKSLKLLVQQVTGSHKVPTSMPILLSAMGKSFVCELVERCRRTMQKQNHSGPIQIMHVREAVREMDYEQRRAPDACKQVRAPLTKTRTIRRLLRR